MKTSFYFVLWQLAWLPATLLDIPFLNEYGFFFAFIIVIVVNYIIRKLLKNQIEYHKARKIAGMMEIAYSNNYKQYKEQALYRMLAYMAPFVCLLVLFIALFTEGFDVPPIDYVMWGAFVILTALVSSWFIIPYIQIVKAKKIILEGRLQDLFQDYKAKRNTSASEEMIPPKPKYYQAMNATNRLFAILCVIEGFGGLIGIYVYWDYWQIEVVGISCALLVFFFGIKDLLSTLDYQDYQDASIAILAFSSILILHVMSPTYYKDCLADTIANDWTYDEKNNIVQKIKKTDDLTTINPTFIKKWNLILLSSESKKKLLGYMVRVGAEYQTVYRDSLGEKRVINIAPSELKEIYHQTKSELNILLELLKLDLGENSSKVYEDGKYILIELLWTDIPYYPTQPEQARDSTWLVNFTKELTEVYGIEQYDRGLKMRIIYKNNQFIEQSLSLEDIKKQRRAHAQRN